MNQAYIQSCTLIYKKLFNKYANFFKAASINLNQKFLSQS